MIFAVKFCCLRYNTLLCPIWYFQGNANKYKPELFSSISNFTKSKEIINNTVDLLKI